MGMVFQLYTFAAVAELSGVRTENNRTFRNRRIV